MIGYWGTHHGWTTSKCVKLEDPNYTIFLIFNKCRPPLFNLLAIQENFDLGVGTNYTYINYIKQEKGRVWQNLHMAWIIELLVQQNYREAHGLGLRELKVDTGPKTHVLIFKMAWIMKEYWCPTKVRRIEDLVYDPGESYQVEIRVRYWVG